MNGQLDGACYVNMRSGSEQGADELYEDEYGVISLRGKPVVDCSVVGSCFLSGSNREHPTSVLASFHGHRQKAFPFDRN